MSEEKLEFRVKSDVKKILQKAADIIGLSLTDFVTNASMVKAYSIIRDHSIVNYQMSQLDEIVDCIKNMGKLTENE